MKIADLFIAIGLSGTGKVKDGLADTRKGLNEATSSAFGMKVAILAAFYALERMVQASNQAGTQLQQFGAYSGQSAENLQRYAYAGRQFGATADEVKGSILGIQKAMAQLETTGQGPAGLWALSRAVGGLDQRQTRDPTYIFNKLTEMLQSKKIPIAIQNQIAESFGMSAGTIGAARQNAFNPEALARANIYTDRQADALRRMNAEWGNLFDNWEKMIGKLNAKHGGQLIHDLTDISKQIINITDNLATLADKLKVFKLLGAVFKEVGTDLKLISDRVAVISGTKTEAQLTKEYAGMKKEDQPAVFRLMDYVMSKAIDVKDLNERLAAANPYLPAQTAGGGVVQNMNFYGPADARVVGAAAKNGTEKAISDATRQSQALNKRKH